MPVIIDELTTEIEVPPPPASGASTGGPERADRPDPVEVVRLLDRLTERATRLSAD